MDGDGSSHESDAAAATSPSPARPQHQQTSSILENMTLASRMGRVGPSPYCCQEPCTVCAKLPLKYRGLLQSMTIRDGQELWDYFDAGYFELMLGGATNDRVHQNEPRVGRTAACLAAEKAQKHLKKLQRDLAEMGLIKQPEQRFTGESEKARLMAPFRKDEIVFGRQIGTGGFSAVYEVEAFRPEANIRPSEHHELEEAARDFLAKHVRRKPQPMEEGEAAAAQEDEFLKRQRKRYANASAASYAVKHLKYALVEDPDKFGKAAVDLALEAQLLLVLDHPHIISLRGWARDGTNAFRRGSPSEYFLILDRLPEILDERIYVWRESLLKYKSRVKVPWLRKKFTAKINKLFIERINVAHNVASAIEYMHDRHIINRDLKTSNIGFDAHGEVKIFDLGLSRLMPKEKYKLEDGYVMSRVGTKATMAPEVRRKQPYDVSADVYSFGVVLWEILTLSTSTDYLRTLKKEVRKRLEDDDVDDDEECLPLPLCSCWPEAIKTLIRKCLSYDPKARPSMLNVRKVLDNQMEALGVSMTGKRRRRRSTLRIDLTKMDVDEFSRTSVDTSLREPLSSTDFRPLVTSSSNLSASQVVVSDNPAEESHGTAPDHGTIASIALPALATLLPDRMTDTSSDSPKLFHE